MFNIGWLMMMTSWALRVIRHMSLPIFKLTTPLIHIWLSQWHIYHTPLSVNWTSQWRYFRFSRKFDIYMLLLISVIHLDAKVYTQFYITFQIANEQLVSVWILHAYRFKTVDISVIYNIFVLFHAIPYPLYNCFAYL